MGCGITKCYKGESSILKKDQVEEDIDYRRNKFSLYTVREELSEMEQSHLPSKRQSILNPIEPFYNN
jgi:hypothetical protein